MHWLSPTRQPLEACFCLSSGPLFGHFIDPRSGIQLTQEGNQVVLAFAKKHKRLLDILARRASTQAAARDMSRALACGTGQRSQLPGGASAWQSK